jgi:hypothetical protein
VSNRFCCIGGVSQVGLESGKKTLIRGGRNKLVGKDIKIDANLLDILDGDSEVILFIILSTFF